MTTANPITYWPSTLARNMKRWWHARRETHYLICADVEQQRAREAQLNVAYYQKKAALARSAKWGS